MILLFCKVLSRSTQIVIAQCFICFSHTPHNMDPMSIAEEERRIKEEHELRELHETVALDEAYFACRDLSGKGRDVHTTAKQRKFVQKEAATIKFNTINNRKKPGSLSDEISTDADDGAVTEIDFNTKPRTFISKGFINRYEPDKILRKFVKRYLFVFNDVILVTNKKEGADLFDVMQVLWVKDLRLRHSFNDSEEDKLSFELIVSRGRNRPRSTILFTCDSDQLWMQWVEDIENVLLAYHRQTDFAKQLGWFHDIIQGNFHSAAYLGDLALVRKHLKHTPIDEVDKTGMTALHWAVLKGFEPLVRFLLDRGADFDALQKGMNSPLLLAAACGWETIARLLIDAGADIKQKNIRGHDAVFMAVLYGHSSKGLPWLLQLLTSKGVDLNEVDSGGATPLHLCAEKNLARPVRMLVDGGADINSRHAKTQLTPIQMACSHVNPDMETIRSFLDKGAYPNWKDLQGRTAFDLAMQNYRGKRLVNPPVSAVVFTPPGAEIDVNHILMNSSPKLSTDIEDLEGDMVGEGLVRRNTLGLAAGNQDRWRPMEDTLNIVGDWAVKSLPALLELCKKGARFDPKDIECLRPSFRAAVLEAKDVWDKKSEPTNFLEFVLVREQAGEDLRLHKTGWSKDKTSSICQLCSDNFGLTNRRHHCRACGVLCCDKCSTKRLQLSGQSLESEQVSGKDKKKEDKSERVCDGCFNRLCHEASQPSADHFRIRQLKQCALDVIRSIEELIDALDDPDGEVNNFQASLRETATLTRELEGWNTPVSSKSPNVRKAGMINLGGNTSTSAGNSPMRSSQDLIEILKKRETRLYRAEDVLSKFLESSVGYHRITKKLIEQKLENSRLWGNNHS